MYMLEEQNKYQCIIKLEFELVTSSSAITQHCKTPILAFVCMTKICGQYMPKTVPSFRLYHAHTKSKPWKGGLTNASWEGIKNP